MRNKLPIGEYIDRIQQHWPQASTDASDIVLCLIRLNEIISARTELALLPFRLTRASFEVLATLRALPAPYQMQPKDLSNAVLMTTGGMTKVLKGLEEAKFIALAANDRDARSKLVTLTPAGRDIVERAMAQVLIQDRQIFAALNPSDMKNELRTLLMQVLTQVE